MIPYFRFSTFLSYPWQLLAGLFLLLNTAPAAHAQGPAWQTALAIPQTADSFSFVTQTALAANGDLYVTGTFSGTITLGANTLTTRLSQMFLAKWSSTTKQFIWGITQGDGLSPDGIAVQGSTIYVSATMGLPTGYVSKFTDAGTSVSAGWIKTFPNTYMGGIGVNGSDIYLSGSFVSPTLTLGSITLTNTVYSSMFVAKLTDAGATSSYTWALKVVGNNSATPPQIVVQGASVYLAGAFLGTISFGATQFTSAGQGDVFISKLTDNGSTAQFTWAKSLTGSSNDAAYGLAVSGSNIYVGGTYFSPTLTCGSTTLSNSGAADIFVTKLTDAGSTSSIIWAQRAGGSGTDVPGGLLVQGSTVYAYGYFGASTTATFGATTLTSADVDGFVTALADAGTTSTFSWAASIGSTDADYITSMAVSGPTFYVGGRISSPSVSFGQYTITNRFNYISGYVASFTATVLATSGAKQLTGASLYPNPASSSITLRIPAVAGATQATLTVSNILGQVVRTAIVPLPAGGLTYELGLTGLTKGMYQLHMQAGEYMGMERLAVE